MTNLEQINSAVEQLKKEVWYIAKITVPEILKVLKSIPMEEIKGMSSRVTTCENKITNVESGLAICNTGIANLQERMTACENSIGTLGTLSSAISALQQWKSGVDANLQSLASQIEELGNSGDKYDVIYDNESDDPAINRNHPEGIVGGTVISFTKKDYKRIKLYGSLNKIDAVATCYMDKRVGTDVSLIATSALLDKFYLLRVALAKTGTSFTVNFSASYIINMSNNTFSYSRARPDPNYFIRRVEGYYN